MRADSVARKLAENENIDIRYYSVIYDLIDDVRSALGGLLSPEMREEIIGVAEVRDVFVSPKFGSVAGCMVIEGTIQRNQPIRVLRDNVVIYEGVRSNRCAASKMMSTKCAMVSNAVSALKTTTMSKSAIRSKCIQVKEIARTL